MYADMIQVKESEIVANLNNDDYFLLCRSEHLAKTRSEESPSISEISTTTPFSSLVIGDTRLDHNLLGSASLSHEPLQEPTVLRTSPVDCVSSSLSAPRSGMPTLSHSVSHGRLSVPNFGSPLLERSFSPSSRAMSSAEVSEWRCCLNVVSRNIL